IEKVLDKVRRVFLTHAQDKKLEFKVVKSEKKLPLIRADELKFYQSVASLVDNAIKYTQKGFVRVSTEVDKKNVRIIVEDSGVGISKESLETLFLKFSRGVDNSRLYTEGAGFGLYISKSLVELQGGKVYAESEGIGKGSRFIVEMPIHKCV
ncbi:MAG: HAMP domain-containing sensor histidine kinase, partial [Patescibacteria group bacterium]